MNAAGTDRHRRRRADADRRLSGRLKDVSAPSLARAPSKRLCPERDGAEEIDEVVMGCVLSAGLGQAPARQAALGAGLPETTGCVTVNKMCGSGMKAIMLAHDALLAGSARVVVAGGMESMSNAPYLLDRARSGYRMGHRKVLDHMFLDGLEDAYEKGRLMGSFAEDCATQLSIHPRDAGRICARLAGARAARHGRRDFRARDRALDAGKDGKGERLIASDELPG